MLYRLGQPVLPEPIPCPLCEQPINIYGDHATCCTKSGDIIVRHNSLRNLVNDIAAMLSPVLEKKDILGRRPAMCRHRRRCYQLAYKYDASFVGKTFFVVWETLGAMNAEGEDLRQIFRFAAKQLGPGV